MQDSNLIGKFKNQFHLLLYRLIFAKNKSRLLRTKYLKFKSRIQISKLVWFISQKQ